jgi:hypothetical protein
MEKLATHRHIKHFRTDLHKYIDLSFNHVKDVPETMSAARLEMSPNMDQEVPVLPETGVQAPASVRPSFIMHEQTESRLKRHRRMVSQTRKSMSIPTCLIELTITRRS